MENYFPPPDQCPRHMIFPGVVISTWTLDHVMLSYVEMQPHAVVPEHRHPHEQLGLVLEGRAIFTIGGEERMLQAGDRFRIPSNVPHQVIALDRPFKALDAFSPPREEYR